MFGLWRKFINDFQCKTHITVSKSDRPLDCPYRYKSLKEKDDSTGNERIHTGYRPYKCED